MALSRQTVPLASRTRHSDGERVTAGSVVGEAARRLASVTDTPRLDAEILLAHALGISRVRLLTHLREPAESSAFSALLERRLRHEPLAYILGEWEFFSLPFTTRAPVLVPRPETEHLVEAVLDFVGEDPADVCEVGVGSGCVSVSIAVNAPQCRIVGTDIAAEALALCRENVARHGVGDRVSLIQTDILDGLRMKRDIFDVVCANPPYIALHERESLMPTVRDYEDPRALFGGEDGFSAIRDFSTDALFVLRSGGFFAMEIGMGQDVIANHILDASGYISIECHEDLAGIPRIITGRRP